MRRLSTNGAVVWGQNYQSGNGVYNLRRLNKRGNFVPGTGTNGSFTPAPLNGTHVQLVLKVTPSASAPTAGAGMFMSMAIADTFEIDSSQTGATLTIPSFESDFNVNPTPAIPPCVVQFLKLGRSL